VGELLTAAVPALTERLLEDTIRREWRQLLPPDLSRRSEPGELRRGTLEVRVDNSIWLHELTMRSEDIVAGLARRHGLRISSVHIRLGRLELADGAGAASAPRPPREARPRLTPEETRDADALVAELTDPEIAHALRRLYTKDRLARRRTASPAATERAT
jgi:hypothetical protein